VKVRRHFLLVFFVFVPTYWRSADNAVLSSINPSPGVARQLLTFLVSPRKVSQRRRPRFAAPLRGVPVDATHKSGRETNSLRSDKFPFFFRFVRVTNGDS
jgi:hypothetical protein